MNVRRILFSFVGLVVSAAPFALGSCAPKVLERIAYETDTLKVKEYVEVKSRPDTVYVEVPVSSQEVVTNDTVSHLEDTLYESDASWDGQRLHHSLKSKPGVKLEKIVLLHDTIKVKEKEGTRNKKFQEAKTIYVQSTFKDKAWYYGIGFVLGIIISTAYGCRKKIRQIIAAAWK